MVAGSYCHGSLPALKGLIAYQAQSVEKKLVPWTVETFSTAATFTRLSDDLRNGLSSTAVSLLLQRGAGRHVLLNEHCPSGQLMDKRFSRQV
jgi:hypothetical protein